MIDVTSARVIRGHKIIVDADNAHLLELNLHIKTTKKKMYAVHSERFGKVPLHHLVMGVRDREVDHVNGNGLDNRRCNLRFATRSQNMANQSKNRPGSSQYKGIYWDSSRGKWRAKIAGSIDLGRFDNEIDAAKAYDEAARRYYGDFARTNF